MRGTFGRRRRRWPRVLAVVVVVVAIGAGVAFFIANRNSSSSLPNSQVDAFLTSWSRGDAPGMAAQLDTPPPTLAKQAMSLVQSAPGSKAEYKVIKLTRDKGKSDRATATYHAHVDLPAFGPVDWDGSLPLAKTKTGWKIRWDPSDLYPGLQGAQRLVLHRTWPTRASILAADGSVLSGVKDSVDVGVRRDHITDLNDVKKHFSDVLHVDPALIDAALAKGPKDHPDWFLYVTTVPRDAVYTTVIHPALEPVGGITFQTGKSVQPTSAVLASQVIGTVGDATAERLQRLGPPYKAGDKVGISGLQATFEKQLAGTPAGTVDVVNDNGATDHQIVKFPGTDPRPVKLTIDPKTQTAAENALVSVKPDQKVALVAIDTKTGAIRAVVSKPDSGSDRALEGKYPPGSTFKVITSAALLANGSNAATPAPCPATRTVDGEQFKNFEGEASDTLNLAQAFAQSCNNAFIGLATQLPNNALSQAAGSFGFNAKWSLPVTNFGGSYPPPKDQAELAASSIGQGRVEASPAQMASVAAAVASGQWHSPVLTTDPAPQQLTATPLAPAVLDNLRTFMAGVVAPGGTAAGAKLPAGTLGKTGTAETGAPTAPTHAWFIGYRGDVAFAVIVEDGGVGGEVAAPLAASFLNGLG